MALRFLLIAVVVVMLHWCAVALIGLALLLLLHFLSLLVTEVLVWNDNLLVLLPLESLPLLVLVELVLNWLVLLVLELELVMLLLVHRQVVVVMLQLTALQSVLLQCW